MITPAESVPQPTVITSTELRAMYPVDDCARLLIQALKAAATTLGDSASEMAGEMARRRKEDVLRSHPLFSGNLIVNVSVGQDGNLTFMLQQLDRPVEKGQSTIAPIVGNEELRGAVKMAGFSGSERVDFVPVYVDARSSIDEGCEDIESTGVCERIGFVPLIPNRII